MELADSSHDLKSRYQKTKGLSLVTVTDFWNRKIKEKWENPEYEAIILKQ